MQESYFLFYGKILGLWYELDCTNMQADGDSKITPSKHLKVFKQNVRKAYPNKKIVWLKVGSY
jgi:hypothetical protein